MDIFNPELLALVICIAALVVGLKML